jgi:hypothetical protein
MWLVACAAEKVDTRTATKSQRQSGEVSALTTIDTVRLEFVEDSSPQSFMASSDPTDFYVETAIAPTKGEIKMGEDGSISYTPLPNRNGTDMIMFNLIPRHADMPERKLQVDIEIIPVNDAPVIESQTIRVVSGSTTQASVKVWDPDGGPVQIKVARQGTLGTVEILDSANGSISYEVSGGFGTDVIEFIATDGALDSAVTPVLFEILP